MTETQIQIANQALSNTWLIDCIRRTNLIPQILREKVIDDLIADVKIDKATEEGLLEDFRKDNNLEEDDDLARFYKDRFIDQGLLMHMLTRPNKIIKYREDRWGPAIKSLYLKYKEDYDIITFNSLESIDFDAMQEIYFRLKDDNASWDSYAKAFQGNQNAIATIGPVSVSQINSKLVETMRTRDTHHIHMPILIGNRYAVVQLLKFEAGQLDEATKNDILNKQFDALVQEELTKATSSITFLPADHAN